MEFLYLSPEFPPNYANFILQLDAVGVNVWAIGEADFYDLPQAVQSALKWYARADLSSFSAVERAVGDLLRAKAKLGTAPRFDAVESHNEMWLETEAFINQRLGIGGIRPEDLGRLKKKSLMKAHFQACGLAPARGEKVLSPEHGLRLAGQLGYPLILKPDEGVGAGGIQRIDDPGTLQQLLCRMAGDYVLEEFIEAPIVSYDGLVGWRGELIFENSLTYGEGVLAYVGGKDTFFYVNRRIPEALKKVGRQLVRHFDVRRKFFHFEFFYQAGRYLPIEINCRPPGGAILDMMNYSIDDDLYAAYARMIAQGQATVSAEKKYYCAYVGRRQRDYRLDQDQVLQRCGRQLVECGPNPPVFRAAMSDWRYIVRSPSETEMLQMADDILQRQQSD
jgi:hypothetical protein